MDASRSEELDARGKGGSCKIDLDGKVLEKKHVVPGRAQELSCGGMASQGSGSHLAFDGVRCFNLLIRGVANCSSSYIFKDFLLTPIYTLHGS